MPRKKSAAKRAREEAEAAARAARAPTARSLWDDEDGDGSETLVINQEYASRFEHNKKREELQRLQEKHGHAGENGAGEDEDEDEDDESSDEDEDEDADLVTPAVDSAILATILALKAKDPAVYEAQADYFDRLERQAREQAKNLSTGGRRGKEAAPVRLKDYHRQNLLAGGEAASAEEGGEGRGVTHVEEQNQLQAEARRAFHEAGNGVDGDDGDDDDDFLAVRQRTDAEQEDEENAYRQFLIDGLKEKGSREMLEKWLRHDEKDDAIIKEYKDEDPIDESMYSQILDNANGKEDDSSAQKGPWVPPSALGPIDKEAESRFLMDFMVNRKWLSRDDTGKIPHYSQIVDDAASDASFEDRNEDFEQEYNLRFERGAEEQNVSHPRDIPDSLRRKDDKRARERAARAERKQKEKEQKLSEMQRLKNLKQEELMKKLEKVRSVTGRGVDVTLQDIDLEGDFDADDFDQKMNKMFDEAYYTTSSDKHKPEFEDDIDISDIVPDNDGNNGESVQDDSVGIEHVIEGNRRDKGHKSEARENKRKLRELIADKFQYDYEDVIGGDLPTRFKYAKTDAESYGLDALDILNADDTDLNELIGLKKLHPYRPKDLREKDKRKYGKKRRLKEWRQKVFGKSATQ